MKVASKKFSSKLVTTIILSAMNGEIVTFNIKGAFSIKLVLRIVNV